MKTVEKFYRNHQLLVNLLLIALIFRLAYLNLIVTPIFDENFYIPAARQILQTGVDPNPEHPPLVKFILASSVWAFGDHPLSWRLPSVFFGILSVAFLYFITLNLTRNKIFATLSATLLAFDPLHLVFSRIAMLDIFMLAFMLGGAYFALKKDYALAGFLFGLGTASKWPAILGLIGTSIFLLIEKKRNFRPFHAGYLFIITALTYALVYTPFIVSQGPFEWALSQVYYIGKASAIPNTSEQSSLPAQWLFCQKSIWLTWNKPDTALPADTLWLVNILSGQPMLAIIALGNPIFWIPGLFALGWLALNKKRSPVKKFSLLWFACVYLPFLLIPRTHTFLYYMLPVLPAYAIAVSQYLMRKRLTKWYLIPLMFSFFILLPLSIGLPAPESYFEALRPFIGVRPIE